MTGSDRTTVRIKSATLHGQRVVYREAGDPADPLVLLVHGMSSDSATWDPVIPAIAEQSYVLAPDLIGHGGSDKPRADYSLGAFATGLRDLVEHLGHERATVVGHSLGGGVALQFAHQYHGMAERLVLVASGGLGREVTWVLRAATLPASEYVLPVIANHRVVDAGRSLARLFAWTPIRPLPSVREAVRSYGALADLPSRTAFIHTLRSVVEPGGQRVTAMDKLYLGEGRPTMIVWGAHDSMIPVAHAYAAHAAVPGSRLEVFEQAGHFPFQDEPERFAGLMLDFLATTEPTVIDRTALRSRLASGDGVRHDTA